MHSWYSCDQGLAHSTIMQLHITFFLKKINAICWQKIQTNSLKYSQKMTESL